MALWNASGNKSSREWHHQPDVSLRNIRESRKLVSTSGYSVTIGWVGPETESKYVILGRKLGRARFLFKRNRLRCVRCMRCVNENCKKRKRLRWQAANHGYHCFDWAFLLADACVCFLKFSRNKRNRQPIGMLGRSSGNHDWLLANASACVSCGFRLRNARNASDCVWMETGLQSITESIRIIMFKIKNWQEGSLVYHTCELKRITERIFF